MSFQDFTKTWSNVEIVAPTSLAGLGGELRISGDPLKISFTSSGMEQGDAEWPLAKKQFVSLQGREAIVGTVVRENPPHFFVMVLNNNAQQLECHIIGLNRKGQRSDHVGIWTAEDGDIRPGKPEPRPPGPPRDR